ncbi:MFS transporter [Brevibacterium sp. UCMA 11754]|nr:MFS transporter [Brevibacterium sp. UCMA 11754]
MSIAAVPLSSEWQLSGATTGLLLSTGSVGMLLGAVLVAPSADRYGRRNLQLFCIALAGLGMVLSGVTSSSEFLMATRFLTGIGVGAVIPIQALIVGEFFPLHRRATAIGLCVVGTPAGSAIGGAAGEYLITHLGWRSIFFAGGAATLMVLIALFLLLPETPDFLDSSRKRRQHQPSRERLERFVRTTEPFDPSTMLRVSSNREHGRSADLSLKSIAMVILAIAFVMINGAYYMANLWLPQLLVLSGIGDGESVRAITFFSIGGAVGALLFSALTTRYSAFASCLGLLAGGIAAFIALSMVTASVATIYALSFVLGMCMLAVLGSLSVLALLLFRTEVRASAVGIGGGAGRIGAILSPLGVGLLVDAGWSSYSIFRLASVPAIVAFICIFAAGVLRSRKMPERRTKGSEPA